MLQPRICLLGLLPFRPIIRIGCRPTPAECGLDRPAARARQIAGVRMTRLHGSAVFGSVRLSLERGDLEPGPVGAPGTSTAGLVVSSPPRLPWASKDARTSPTSSSLRGPLRVRPGSDRLSRACPLFSCCKTPIEVKKGNRPGNWAFRCPETTSPFNWHLTLKRTADRVGGHRGVASVEIGSARLI